MSEFKMENGGWKLALVRRASCFAILYLLSSVLTRCLAQDLPPHVIPVPVLGARSVELHPTKPLLYVGLAGRTNGMALTTFQLDSEGRLIPDNRRQHADGIVEGAPLSGSQYAITDIAVDPTQAQLYVNATPDKLGTFRQDTNVAFVAALALDEEGMPHETLQRLRGTRRTLAIRSLFVDPLGRFLYFGESHAWVSLWPVADEELIQTLKTQPVPPPRRSAARPKKSGRQLSDFQLKPPIRLSEWRRVPEWRRCYGSDVGTTKIVFTFTEDGRAIPFAQAIATQSKYNSAPPVSVRHRKLYVPNARGSEMGIYQLTREGRPTSVTQFVKVDPVRLACVDDVHDRLCIANSRSLPSVYSLDADGLPKGEPQRFDLKATMINDMVVAKNGVLYVACTSPPGGVL